MKRATPTPNRFIISTQSWPVKGLILFIGLIFLGSCLDEASLVGNRKTDRFEVKYQEFKIPAYTVQADSVRSNVYTFSQSPSEDRLLCGEVDYDPNFGKISSTTFFQFIPTTVKLNQTGKTNIQFLKLTLNLILDYYVYGDTINNTASNFKLFRVDSDINSTNNYFTNSYHTLGDELATGTYNFRSDSIRHYLKYNRDTDVTNNIYDSLFFDLTNTPLADGLYDTALLKGIYTPVLNADGVTYTSKLNVKKTDSSFLKNFKGLAVVPVDGNRVLGFTTLQSTSFIATSRLTLYYSYIEDGKSKIGQLYYFLDGQGVTSTIDLARYSSISADRSGTYLAGQPGLPTGQLATNVYNNFTAADDFCYLQGGTGLYSKLDFTEVRDFFNQVDLVAINSARLTIDLPTNKTFLKPPAGMFLRTVQNQNRFYVPPSIQAIGSNGKPIVDGSGNPILVPDPTYAANFYCSGSQSFLDVRSDGETRLSSAPGVLVLSPDNNKISYSGYLTEYLEYHTRLPQDFARLDFLGLVPSHSETGKRNDPRSFGKFLDGVSFHKDSVKLKVYYSVPKQ